MARVELAEWLRERGIPAVDNEGREIPNFQRNFQRFSYVGKHDDDAGWIKSGQDSDGTRFCLAGDWRSKDKSQWFEGRTTNHGLTPEQKSARAAEIAETQEKERLERQQGEARAAATAKALMRSAQPKPHPYLESKGFSGPLAVGSVGTEYPGEGALLVPVYAPGGELVNLQRISDGKKFLYGGRVDNCYHLLGQLEAPLLICEGYATGLTLHRATGKNVLVTFSAGNMEKVVVDISKSFRHSELLICGDDDSKKASTGQRTAEAIFQSHRIRACFPQWPADAVGATDFNDLASLSGEAAVRVQVETALATLATASEPPVETDEDFVDCLGYRDGTFYYTSSSNKEIVRVGAGAHVTGILLSMMPRRYWLRHYPGAKDGTISWDSAASDLMERCRKRGLYDDSRVRGRGCWKGENKELVVHRGSDLLVNGKATDLSKAGKKHVYRLGLDLAGTDATPLTQEEGRKFRDVSNLLTFTNKESSYHLAGYAAIMRITGALKWRPHLWVTGSAGCGKSVTAIELLKRAAGSWGINIDGKTSEAGVRQLLNDDALPVIYDEAESNDAKDGRRMQNILDLIRQASRGGRIVKGSPGGKATTFHVNSTFVLGSIQVSLQKEADFTRFTVVELAKDKKNDWPTVKAGIDSIDEEYGDRLFARMISRFTEFEASLSVFHKLIVESGTGREADQLAPIMAGVWTLENDAIVTEEQARAMLSDAWSAEKAQAAVSDEEEIGETLVSHVVKLDSSSGNSERMPLAELMHLAVGNKAARRQLELYGLTVREERWEEKKEIADFVYVANNHPELERWFGQTKWGKNWSQSLSRLPFATAGRRIDIGGKFRRCVRVPLSVLLE